MPRRQTIITGKILNDLWNVGAKHPLYREDGKWYHHLEDFPGVLFDSNGYIVFKTEQDYLENPYLQQKQDLHITGGISSVPGYVRVSERNQIKDFSRTLRDTLGEYQVFSDASLSDEKPSDYEILKATDLPTRPSELTRVLTQINRIVRDTQIARRVKIVHTYSCQFCGDTLDLGNGRLYAEAHHIKPLGAKHNGPDIVENIMCVCPNHHALLDYGAIPIDLKDLRITSGHIFSEQYIEYHNTNVYKQVTGSIVATQA
jgi:5-methylcytosine-specific restriction protein A